MNLAFCVFAWFPHGGLQRNLLAIAEACRDRGHAVTVWTRSWEGERPRGIAVRELPVRAFTNHGRDAAFHRALHARGERAGADLVVGFNKMPGLDVYYAADTCFALRARRLRGPLHRATARYRHAIRFERSVFGEGGARRILALSRAQIADYRSVYGTAEERFALMPPGIAPDRAWHAGSADLRAAVRAGLDVAPAAPVALFLGSDYRRKGLDRVVHGLAASGRGDAVLLVAGRDRRAARYRELARRAGVATRFLGARDDVPALLFAADVLVHPAREENTGNVLLEAALAGLPVICSAACGWADMVREHGAGRVLDEPFSAVALADALSGVLGAPLGPDARARASRALRDGLDVSSRPERAAEVIEELGRGPQGGGFR